MGQTARQLAISQLETKKEKKQVSGDNKRCKYYGYRDELMGWECLNTNKINPGCGNSIISGTTVDPYVRHSKTRRAS